MMTPAFDRSEKHLNLAESKAEGVQVAHLVESGNEVKPTPQGVQAAAPADGATKSSWHAAHDGWPSLAEKEPALQGVGCVEPYSCVAPGVLTLGSGSVRGDVGGGADGSGAG